MLEAYRQAVLKAAFEGRLTEEFSTKGWKNVKVKDLGKVETGTTPSKRLSANYGDRYLFFKPTDLNTGYNVFDSDDKLSELGFSKSRKLPKNSILVTCIGATIGKTGIIRVEGTSNQQINAIIPNSEINANFIYFQCISHYFQDQIKKNASSTTLPILNKSKFEQLNFKLPTRDQQDKIVKKLEMIFEMEGYINKNIENLLLLIEITKQSILKQAFSGKLVPQDPDDEPAEELLKRSKISNLAKQ